jgi:hypothetical protein
MTKHLQFDPMEVDRVELESPKETEHAHYNDDTIGDPEGAEARSEARSELPEWIFNDFELSPKSYFGKRYEDGQLHLIPKKQVIEEIFDIHEQGFNAPKEIGNCLALGTAESDFETIRDAYMMVLEVTPVTESFPLMNAVSKICEEKFAQRAIRKYLFLQACDRPSAKDDYLEELHSRALQASARAGLYFMTHRALWKHLQWNGEPRYVGVRQQIEWAQVRTAEGLEKKHRSGPRVRQENIRNYDVNF